MAPKWLPWIVAPIGFEVGFSSAGAGALGTIVLMRYTDLAASDIVGTDLAFGLMLSIFAAGVFLLHPVQTESVSYVASRSETLSVFFFFAAFTTAS